MRGRSAFSQGNRAGETESHKGPGTGGPLTVLAEAPAFVLLAGCGVLLYSLELGMPAWKACSTGILVMGFLAFSGTIAPCPRLAGMLIFLTGVFISFSVTAAARLDKPVSDAVVPRLETMGTVISERAWGSRRALVIKTGEGVFCCKLPATGLFREGDRVALAGRVRFFEPAPDSGKFEEQTYWRARGVLGEVQDPKIQKRGRYRWSFPTWRDILKERILLNVPRNTRGYILAAWLGNRDPDLAEEHRKWGTSHILAISGFHVGIVALCLRKIARRRVLVPSIFMWGYVLLSGGAASALRAALMFQIAFAGDLLGRPVRSLNAVSAAAVVMLFWSPWWFWDLGWRLSVTAAIVLGSFASRRKTKYFRFAIPLVWYVTGAFISRSFGSVPVAGMVMNIFVVPLFGLLLPVLSVLVLPMLLEVPGSGIPAWAMEFVLQSFHGCAKAVSLVIPLEAGAGFFPAGVVCALLVFLSLSGSGIKMARSAVAGALAGTFAALYV
ncbi:MAG: ComEC/Rec2 family competence protein [Thermovirgaceae bacterium]